MIPARLIQYFFILNDQVENMICKYRIMLLIEIFYFMFFI